MLHKRGCCPPHTSNHTRSGPPRCRQEVAHSRRSTPTQTGPRRTSSRRPILCNAWCSRSVCSRSTCPGISPTDVASCPWRIDRPRILNQSNIRWIKFKICTSDEVFTFRSTDPKIQNKYRTEKNLYSFQLCKGRFPKYLDKKLHFHWAVAKPPSTCCFLLIHCFFLIVD